MAHQGDGFAAVILAAGQGRRMESPLAKVLHSVGGEPMIRHVVVTAREAGAAPVVIVVGHRARDVQEAFTGDDADIVFSVQEEQLGTGHAAEVGLSALSAEVEHLYLLCGDAPLIRTATLSDLAHLHEEAGAAATMLTATAEDPYGYGRVVREGAQLIGVVEEADATEAQKKITEISTGAYVFEAAFLRAALPRIRAENNQGEFYLPDVFPIARAEGRVILGLELASPEEALGVNTKADLRRAEEIHEERKRKA
ncbi:MAG: NTP transferase domain-containing protein [Nitrospinae bacterium]|nr:NTP transferase domain-containing protein [Nitrospinota bacterium]